MVTAAAISVRERERDGNRRGDFWERERERDGREKQSAKGFLLSLSLSL
jgi:hypothetical protein